MNHRLDLTAKPDLDRELSRNKINGGRINFPGIKDLSDYVLSIADDGITVDVIKTKVIANNLSIQKSHGSVTATKLHVDEISRY